MVSPSGLGSTGNFNNIEWEDWIKTFNLNFLSQVYFIHELLERRNKRELILSYGFGQAGQIMPQKINLR